MMASKIVHTLMSYVYTGIFLKLKPQPPIQTHPLVDKDNHLPIAVICDTMTWKNLSQEHAAVFLTPRTWQDTLSKPVKFLLCEAAWSGAEGNLWRGQVYKDRRVLYENRHSLLRILEQCRSKGIPTVFWAKEDPVYFNHEVYDFTDTALRFDYILTTAKECIEKYQALGTKNVHYWSFGFSSSIYYPQQTQKEQQKEHVAVFAGSWLTNHPKRCKDLTNLFDTVLDKEIPLKIYDRHRFNGVSTKPFPQKYQPFVHDAVLYEELGDIYRTSDYVINVNTADESSTMFSRRVYEAMACGCIVITNKNNELKNQFSETIWFVDEDFDFSRKEIFRQKNIETVFASHTWEQRMKELFAILEIKE